jgi:hypothetical protein
MVRFGTPGTYYNLECCLYITATFGQLPVTESVVLPPGRGQLTMLISEKYRGKALSCEKLSREVANYDFKCAWTEIAMEWHALANRRAQEVSQRGELENIRSSLEAASVSGLLVGPSLKPG